MKHILTKNIFSNASYLYGLAIAFIGGLSSFYIWGDVKYWAQIGWFDVFAEGGMTLLAIFWLVLLLRSRPGGNVTRLLAIGLCAISFAWSMDVVDEFIKLPDTLFWRDWLEAVPITIALIFLSAGIYQWHKEELAISAQMVKRELNFRDHRLFDKLIPVGGAAYLRKQLDSLIKESKQAHSPLSLVAVDLDNFNYLNRRYGMPEGDNILQSVCQLLLLNLREQDLLCRLAGDRFVVLLPETNQAAAEKIADELATAVASLAYKDRNTMERIYLTASVATTFVGHEDTNSVLKRLSVAVAGVKQSVA